MWLVQRDLLYKTYRHTHTYTHTHTHTHTHTYTHTHAHIHTHTHTHTHIHTYTPTHTLTHTHTHKHKHKDTHIHTHTHHWGYPRMWLMKLDFDRQTYTKILLNTPGAIYQRRTVRLNRTSISDDFEEICCVSGSKDIYPAPLPSPQLSGSQNIYVRMMLDRGWSKSQLLLGRLWWMTPHWRYFKMWLMQLDLWWTKSLHRHSVIISVGLRIK